jgi:hypothetical protein
MGYVNANLLASAAVPHLVQLADLDENKVTPGLLGFVVFALIGGATWLLVRNMTKQLKKIDFEQPPARTGRADEDRVTAAAESVPSKPKSAAGSDGD